MVRGIEKRPFVKGDRDRRDFVSRLGRVALETETAVFAWALMENHSHLLLKSSGHGLSGFMRRLLTGYDTIYNRRYRRHDHLFQNRVRHPESRWLPAYAGMTVCGRHRIGSMEPGFRRGGEST
jgi:REP element-mobilizing transposase RayT